MRRGVAEGVTRPQPTPSGQSLRHTYRAGTALWRVPAGAYKCRIPTGQADTAAGRGIMMLRSQGIGNLSGARTETGSGSARANPVLFV